MNEEKWSAFFKYRNGKGLYSIMVFPYLLMISIMYPVTMFGFDLINFDYRVLGYSRDYVTNAHFIFKITKA